MMSGIASRKGSPPPGRRCERMYSSQYRTAREYGLWVAFSVCAPSALVGCKPEQESGGAVATVPRVATLDSTTSDPVAVPEVQKEPLPTWSTRISPGSGFPCEVERVLASSCRRCHWEPRENDAPFALVKWDDTRKERQGSPIFVLMKKQVEAELMPPLDEPVEPPVTPLTSEQKTTLLRWLEQGAERARADEVCEYPAAP